MPKINSDQTVVPESKSSERLQRPKRFAVVFHNDNYTPMDFVIFILSSIFHKSAEDANQIMMEVHKKGRAVAGVFSFEIAETKLSRSDALAQSSGFPLLLSIEPATE